MEKEFIDKLAWIEIRDKKLLMTLTRGKDTWYIPGGKREKDETDAEALMREIQEELAVDLNPESIKKYGVFEAQAHGKPEGVIVRMTCYTAAFQGNLIPSAEIAELAYFSHDMKHKSSVVDNIIFDDLKSKNLIV